MIIDKIGFKSSQPQQIQAQQQNKNGVLEKDGKKLLFEETTQTYLE